MRLLLTNDDGFQSPGITVLADALRGLGHRVFMVAPAADNSGVSHSISFFKGLLKLAEIGSDSYSLDGTPADCVAVALRGGIPELSMEGGLPPDAVVSGINQGANLGTDIVYSGTAAAARQGALCGIKSLALSLVQGSAGRNGIWNWETAAAFAAERLEEMLGFWKPDTFVNVNMPNRGEPPLGFVRSFPSWRQYADKIEVYDAPDGNRYCIAHPERVASKPEPGSDWKAVEENSASVSGVYIHPVLHEDVGHYHYTV